MNHYEVKMLPETHMYVVQIPYRDNCGSRLFVFSKNYARDFSISVSSKYRTQSLKTQQGNTLPHDVTCTDKLSPAKYQHQWVINVNSQTNSGLFPRQSKPPSLSPPPPAPLTHYTVLCMEYRMYEMT
jgi:hypothetical protein